MVSGKLLVALAFKLIHHIFQRFTYKPARCWPKYPAAFGAAETFEIWLFHKYQIPSHSGINNTFVYKKEQYLTVGLTVLLKRT
jgi:hypothetical protein